MSRVTVVPALRAARQIVRAFSSAILLAVVRAAPGRSAVSLTETSALRVRPRRGELLEDLDVRRHRGLGLLDVGGVLAEEVEGDPDAVGDLVGGRVDAASVVSPGT